MKLAEAALALARFERQSLPGRVVFGPGRLEGLEGELAALGIAAGMLVASGARPALVDRVRRHAGCRLAYTWDEVRQHVPVELVDRAAAALGAADGLVCAGGGSAIGLAKALALRSGLPVVAIPTTYSGSEMTPVWGITEGGEKHTGRETRVLARTVVYDPELFTDLPAAVEGPSALNAFAHCAEALYAPELDPVTRLVAREGATRIARALPVTGTDRLRRCAELVLGAYLAGTAFAAVGGSVHHGLCHLLGGRYGLPHAETHAAVLPHVLFALAPGVPAAMADLAEALGVDGRDVPGACFDQAAVTGCPTGLEALGLSRAAALAVAPDLAAKSDLLDERQAKALLEAAWRGERPGAVPRP